MCVGPFDGPDDTASAGVAGSLSPRHRPFVLSSQPTPVCKWDTFRFQLHVWIAGRRRGCSWVRGVRGVLWGSGGSEGVGGRRGRAGLLATPQVDLAGAICHGSGWRWAAASLFFICIPTRHMSSRRPCLLSVSVPYDDQNNVAFTARFVRRCPVANNNQLTNLSMYYVKALLELPFTHPPVLLLDVSRAHL